MFYSKPFVIDNSHLQTPIKGGSPQLTLKSIHPKPILITLLLQNPASHKPHTTHSRRKPYAICFQTLRRVTLKSGQKWPHIILSQLTERTADTSEKETETQRKNSSNYKAAKYCGYFQQLIKSHGKKYSFLNTIVSGV